MDIITDKDLRYVITALPSFGTRYAHLVMGYAQLFGVTPMHVKAKKLRLIIEEMKKLFDAQSFTWQQKIYSISHAGIAEALDICIKKNFTDKLENHNYIKKVMVGISEREGKGKSKQEEKDLRVREDRLLAGGGHIKKELDLPMKGTIARLRRNDSGEDVPERITSEQAEKNLQRVGEIIKSIGG